MSNDSLFNRSHPAADVAVIGTGIIGIACALRLARQGRRVVVIDQQEPGRGASFGNTGHLATEQVFPIADLSILKRLPAMLMDPMGQLRLDWKYMPRALPWFMRLLLNLRPVPFQRTGHFLDPFQVVGELVHAAKNSGVQFLKQRVEGGQLMNTACH